MKHPAAREFFAYWDSKRGDARAPERSEIEPASLRELLGDIFVLSCDAATGYPFRVAGTRVCALFGRDLKDQGFSSLFSAASRHEIEDIVAAVAEDTLPAIAGVTTTSPRGITTHLELLLLPFSNRAHTPISLTGLLAPFGNTTDALGELTLTSWRYIHPPPERIVPRALRKLKIARGFMVYEGLH
jgi:hypothetical protein